MQSRYFAGLALAPAAFAAEEKAQATNMSVMNVFDADPPFAIGAQYNYDPGSGNPLGRVISLGVKKRF